MAIINQADYDAAKNTLRAAAEAYYLDPTTSTMSDAEYDQLLRDAAAYEQTNGITTDVVGEAIGAGAALAGNTSHTVPMLSLDNVFSPAELQAWWKRAKGYDLIVEPKLDGMAMSITFVGGKPTQMVTRGDGYTGEDYSHALELISFPTILGRPSITNNGIASRDIVPFNGTVRGEVILSKAQFDRANQVRVTQGKPAYANPRNAGAGILSRASKDRDEAKMMRRQGIKLTFCAYGVLVDDPRQTNHSGLMSALENAGFTTARSLLTDNQRAAAFGMLSGVETTKPVIDFEIDGLVYKVDSLDRQGELGSSSRAPKWAIAYKFPAEQVNAKLIDVVWAVGRTGNVTPRAVISPTQVDGVTISSATLNNPDDIQRKDLMIGDTIVLQRAAAVIPEVVGSVPDARVGTERPILIPASCPNCGETLLTDQARLRCPSGGDCAPVRKIAYACSRDALDIEGLSESTVAALVDAGLICDVGDLFSLTQEQIATCPTGRLNKDGKPILIGKAKAAAIYDDMANNAEHTPFERVVIALGLRGTGRSMSKRLAQHFGSMDAIMAAAVDEIAAVDKLGAVKSASLVQELHTPRTRQTIAKLQMAGFPMEIEEPAADTPQPLAGQTIVVTGPMKQLGSRSEVTTNLEALGATVGSSVGSKTTLVVADDPGGTSSKLAKARKLGVEILDEASFIARFGL